MLQGLDEDDLGAALYGIVGHRGFAAGEEVEPRYLSDAGGHFTGRPKFVLRPADAGEVAALLKVATAKCVPVTVQGGRTGLVGGAVAINGGIALTLERIADIKEIDPTSMTMTVDAGVTLQAAQEMAEAQNLMLPLDLGSRGSATIGGTIATCAGGLRVLRWGTMREMVLGLDAVLADGSIISCGVKSIKDNAGYHWKDLLIGSEGTLAVVTRAILRLRPLPSSVQTAMVSVDSFSAVANLLRRLEGELAGTLTSFELMWHDFYECISEANRCKRERPLPLGAKYNAIIEAMGSDPEADSARFERVLSRAIDDGLMTDAVIAQSEQHRAGIWSLREDQDAAFRALQPYVLFDVSLALRDVPQFVEDVERGINEVCADATILLYGHAGDGNLHILVHVGELCDAQTQDIIHKAVFQPLKSVGGSISAEHGIGLAKREYLDWTRSRSEIALMRRLKTAFDPDGILNPGKILMEDTMT